MAVVSKYHEAAHTLDLNIEIPDADEAAPAAGHNEQMAEHVKQQSDEFREHVAEEAAAQAERDQEWAERDPKPSPSELLQERGFEPAPEEGGEAGGDVPDGTVDEVLDWVGDDPDRAQQALQAEQEGQNRSTLIAELEKRSETTA